MVWVGNITHNGYVSLPRVEAVRTLASSPWSPWMRPATQPVAMASLIDLRTGGNWWRFGEIRSSLKLQKCTNWKISPFCVEAYSTKKAGNLQILRWMGFVEQDRYCRWQKSDWTETKSLWICLGKAPGERHGYRIFWVHLRGISWHPKTRCGNLFPSGLRAQFEL